MLEKYTADWDNVERSAQPIKGALIYQILNLIGWICAIIITIICASGAIRYSFGSLFNIFATRMTPANYVTIWWFVLLLLLLLFLVYQSFPKQKDNLVLFRDISFLSFLSSLIYMAWIILYSHANFWASAAVSSVLVILLIVIYLRIGIGKKKGTAPLEYLCVHMFWSCSLAWMMCFCFENWAKAARHSIDWYGEPWNQNGWAVLFLCFLSVFALLTLILRRDWVFGLTAGWFLIAVGANQLGWRSTLITAYTAGAILAFLSVIVLILKIFLWFKERRRRGQGAGAPAVAPVSAVTGTTAVPATTVVTRTENPPVITRTVVEPPVVTRTEVVDPRSDVRRDEVVVP